MSRPSCGPPPTAQSYSSFQFPRYNKPVTGNLCGMYLAPNTGSLYGIGGNSHAPVPGGRMLASTCTSIRQGLLSATACASAPLKSSDLVTVNQPIVQSRQVQRAPGVLLPPVLDRVGNRADISLTSPTCTEQARRKTKNREDCTLKLPTWNVFLRVATTHSAHARRVRPVKALAVQIQLIIMRHPICHNETAHLP